MNKTKKVNKIFYLILILIPLIFFILLEGTLRIFNYGTNLSTWHNVTDDYYTLNPDFARRYFHTVKNVPESIQDVFAVNKKKNTFRVFVLGGSSAAGFPYIPLGAFSRYIRVRLEQNYPDKIIEVVNLALSAVNTYTIRDLVPDVLDQQPDLILIYAGHNEYYGALGAGSMESLGKSRAIVNFVLGLNKLKTTQLVRDGIKSVFQLVSAGKKDNSGTLMSRMAQNQQIEFGSETYNLGIEQFRGNLNEIIELVRQKEVPIVISTVASNLKDQPPFIAGNGNARKHFKDAKAAYNDLDFNKADSLFRLAKDLDQLRFRAPEEVNNIIKDLGNKYQIPVVDADKKLSLRSEGNIIGDNLMTDHLHLTVEGYQEIGELFYNAMTVNNYLPPENPIFINAMQDSIARTNFSFSKLDSTIGFVRLKALKNDWPFIRPENALPFSSIFKPVSKIDSLAVRCINKEIDWHQAHITLANHFINTKDFQKFKTQMKVIINQYPIITEYYEKLISELINQLDYKEAYYYLTQNQKLNETQFSNKWLGNLELSNKNYDKAITYLERSLTFDQNDAQVYYNLAGAYSQINQYNDALQFVNKCLALNSNYLGAKNLKVQLESILKNQGRK